MKALNIQTIREKTKKIIEDKETQELLVIAMIWASSKTVFLNNKQEKKTLKETVKTLIDFAIPSLNPDDFVELERITKDLIDTYEK